MSTFMLVHGSWHGGWCWKRVRHRLRELGHHVYTPTLTGLADRSHLLTRSVNLSTHIDDVANLIRWEELSDVVLCGHSYSGMVITGVADRMPDRIRALVYLDAAVPENGESALDLLPEALHPSMIEPTMGLGEGWKTPPMAAAVFRVNAKDEDWVDRQCTWQPFACFKERLQLSEGIRSVTNVTFILCAGWDGALHWAHERARAKGWRTITLSCGHEAMLDCPEDLTRELVVAGAARFT